MSRYVFRSEWHLPAGPDEVYAALADVAGYATWWPQVTGARWLDGDSGEFRCRSVLPYELTVVLHREVEDPAAGVLRARLDGDMSGTSQWTVAANHAGSVAVFDEEVVVHKGLVRAAGVLARPVLRYNHDVMMRAGEKGLRAYLQH